MRPRSDPHGEFSLCAAKGDQHRAAEGTAIRVDGLQENELSTANLKEELVGGYSGRRDGVEKLGRV